MVKMVAFSKKHFISAFNAVFDGLRLAFKQLARDFYNRTS